MKRLFVVVSIGLFACAAVVVSQTRNYSVEEMMKVRRIADPQISPNGERIAFMVGDVNLYANRVVNQIYVIASHGGEAKRLTSGDQSSTAPRWSPDGKKIAYITGGQVWVMEDDGDHKDQVTRISTDAAAPVWSPDGKWIAFTSDVYPDCRDDECNKRKDDQAEKSKVKAHVTERLLFRHWNEWRDVKRTHVFIVSSKGGTASDLTPGDFDSPPYAAATGVDYAFSPDSKEVAYFGIQTASKPSQLIVTFILYLLTGAPPEVLPQIIAATMLDQSTHVTVNTSCTVRRPRPDSKPTAGA